VLVQANYGRRGLLRIDGVPIGEEITIDEVPSPWATARRGIAAADRAPGSGSIIGIVATDAPLLPHQCARLARRLPLGIARVGGLGSTSSGDIFLAFATGNRGMAPTEAEAEGDGTIKIRGMVDRGIDPLFEAAVEATEEAIANALVAAETMTGRDGIVAHRLPHDRLVEVMRRHGRLRGRAAQP